MPLAPDIKQYLEGKALSGAPEAWQAPLDLIRANTHGRIALAGKIEKVFSMEDRYIPGPTADLHIRIYRPIDGEDLPALVYFHGGGWVLNFLDIYDAELCALANASGSVIVAVNYQKAPEHPYPIPLMIAMQLFSGFTKTHLPSALILQKLGSEERARVEI